MVKMEVNQNESSKTSESTSNAKSKAGRISKIDYFTLIKFYNRTIRNIYRTTHDTSLVVIHPYPK